MAKKRVIGKKEAEGVHRFQSPFTGEYVMGFQYIAETIIKRKANKDGFVLEYKFWNDKDHKYYKEFRSQVTQAAKLCKKYNAKVIVKTLTELFWCFSLRNKKFLEALEKNSILYKKSVEESKKIETSDTKKTFVSSLGKKSMLSKLREKERGNDG